jgi:thiol-disulfide isomerase/thioredoxin
MKVKLLKNNFNSSILLLLLFSFVSVSSCAQVKDNFLLQGRVDAISGQFIYFSYKGYGNGRIWDSTVVKENTFEFRGKLTGQAKCYISTIKSTNTDFTNVTAPFYIESSIVTINISSEDFKKCIITGSRIQTELDGLNKNKKSLYVKLAPLTKLKDSLSNILDTQINPVDSIKIRRKINETESKMRPYLKNEIRLDKKFIVSNTSSLAATNLVLQRVRYYSLKELQIILNNMPEANRISPWGQEIQEYIFSRQQGLKGSMAKQFEAKELNGDSLKLSHYKGKFVLLDFWASWCVPCRAGNPELIRLYSKYKQKGIEFIGVADDNSSEDKWRDAIKKDSIDLWKHVLRMANGIDISELYGIHMLPTKILIDPNGKIIERFGEGGVDENLLERLLEKALATK